MRRFVPPIVTIIILVIIYWRIDWADLAHHLVHLRWSYFVSGVSLFLLTTIMAMERWRLTLRGTLHIRSRDALALGFGASAFNAVVPSTLGSFGIAYYLKRKRGLTLKRGIASVLLARILDMMGLSIVVLVGSFLLPRDDFTVTIRVLSFCMITLIACFYLFSFSEDGRMRRILDRMVRSERLRGITIDTQEFLHSIRKRRGCFALILLISIGIWLIFTAQIYLFYHALNHSIPLYITLALAPLVFLAGSAPFTISGIGTRDTALIVLFAPYAPASVSAGVGVLCIFRNLISALAGLPFIRMFFSVDKEIEYVDLDESFRGKKNSKEYY